MARELADRRAESNRVRRVRSSLSWLLACAIAICESGLLCCSAAAAEDDAPQALQGKSAVIQWREIRIQRQIGEENFHGVTADLSLNLYFSTQGRTFIRDEAIVDGRSGRFERRLGEEKHWGLNFTGRSMTFFNSFNSGGARRFAVTFRPHFEGCVATVSFGRMADSPIIMWSNITHKQQEVESLKVSRTKCSVHEGNIFEAQ